MPIFSLSRHPRSPRVMDCRVGGKAFHGSDGSLDTVIILQFLFPSLKLSVSIAGSTWPVHPGKPIWPSYLSCGTLGLSQLNPHYAMLYAVSSLSFCRQHRLPGGSTKSCLLVYILSYTLFRFPFCTFKLSYLYQRTASSFLQQFLASFLCDIGFFVLFSLYTCH